MANYAVLDASANVVNVVIWDGVAQWSPPVDCTTQLVTDATGAAFMGGRFASGRFLPRISPSHPRVTDDSVQVNRLTTAEKTARTARLAEIG